MKRYVAASLLLAAWCPLPAGYCSAEELMGSVKVSGAEVEVRIQHKDGRPAAGVQVRMLYARQLTTAAAGTDAQGRWVHVVARPGPYEAVVESNADGEDSLRLPFTVLETEEANAIPWAGLATGLVCICAAVLLLVVSGSRGLGFPSSPDRKEGRIGILTHKWKSMSVGALLSAGAGLLIWSAWGYWLTPAPLAVGAGPDVAGGARDFLLSRDVRPLSDPLERLLADNTAPRVKTQPHPLLGQPAPDFELTDHQQKVWRLRERLDEGPVVLVFYYGYHCNHCVGQLFAVHADIAKFHELGGQVLAVSADPPEWTRARFKQYGEFAFPVLSDPGNKVAQAYEMFQPASGKAPEDLQHGTFVVGRDGLVHWTQYGYEPFTGNPTLLYELARLEGRLPAGLGK